MEIVLTLLLGVLALVIIWLIVKSVLKKDVKDLNISYSPLKGFTLNCTFFK